MTTRGGDDTLIRVAVDADLPAVCDVHLGSFPGFFLSRMGPRFLRAYYRCVLTYEGSIFLVAETAGIVSGFVAGFVNSAGFYRHLVRSSARFVVPTACAVFVAPALLIRVMDGRRRVGASTVPSSSSHADAELASLAVVGTHSGRGIGRLLVADFVVYAQRRRCRQVSLTTDASENDRVNEFYSSLGFVLDGAFDQRGERKMNRYVLMLTGED
jgi:ribosomal protein S18 acetylase RimI-like enzyme